MGSDHQKDNKSLGCEKAKKVEAEQVKWVVWSRRTDRARQTQTTDITDRQTDERRRTKNATRGTMKSIYRRRGVGAAEPDNDKDGALINRLEELDNRVLCDRKDDGSVEGNAEELVVAADENRGSGPS